MMKRTTISTLLIKILGIWASVMYILVFFLTFQDPISRAVVGMAGGLAVLWIIIGGTIMLKSRHRVRRLVLNLPGGWKSKFVLFATALALIEEAITTTMTNLAPAFGAKVGEAYITASADYLDVVLFHSVIVFIPMFVAWAWLLSRYDFDAKSVFILFGITGTLAEALTFGVQNLGAAGFWVFVYGLMVFLPAYTLPQDRGAEKPRPWHYPLAVVVPFAFAIPVALIVSLIHPIQVHF
ncbi:MAG: hypothetical protein ACE5HJ_08770 [Thermoplasmata archaeon]